ncbi:hypothetical protein BJ742DRAFT_49955 [Cladochytrium replicatum]|nr:hypothetical protein BJ742DRAFT_49955 [Cladochytrium replicatum]
MVSFAFTCMVQSSCPTSNGIWKPELLFNTLFLTYAACAHAHPIARYGPTAPYSAGFPMSASDMIREMFVSLVPSSNARLFLIDEKGHLLASSTNSPIANDGGTDFGTCRQHKPVTGSSPNCQRISKPLQTPSRQFGPFSDHSKPRSSTTKSGPTPSDLSRCPPHPNSTLSPRSHDTTFSAPSTTRKGPRSS